MAVEPSLINCAPCRVFYNRVERCHVTSLGGAYGTFFGRRFDQVINRSD